MKTFVERHTSKIIGTLSGFDRVVITGTLPDICHAEAMATHLGARGVRLFDYPQFALRFREEIRSHAEQLARQNGLTIDFIRRKNFRKEERIKAIVAERGDHPGLVHIFSAMEPCPSFKPWHDKATGKTMLRPTEAKCLHYYFYFIHPELGLCYLRVPTWAPFRLQFYFNGHNHLALKLKEAGIAYTLMDNAFVNIADFPRAQELADSLDIRRLHWHLDCIAAEYCPVTRHFPSGYHWSLMQVEYATDVVFRRQVDFQPLYEAITHTAIHAIKPEHVATFLGRKLTGSYEGEAGNDFHTRIQGTCIKHHLGAVAIKLYDKFGLIGRVECTANDVTFFKHHRTVEHRDGTTAFKLAPLRKSIYSLPVLRQLLRAATHRYLDFVAAIDDPSTGLRSLEKISAPVRRGDRSYRGFNLFCGPDLDLFQAMLRGEFTISGFQAGNLRSLIPNVSSGQLSRMLKRLRTHGLIKKIGRRYKYYLTTLGRTVATAGLKLRELVIIPTLDQPVLA
ncbi:MAG: MarR family transcriptional regulator [Chloroflexota bacterium]